MGAASGRLSGRGLLCGMAAGAILGVLIGLSMTERLTPAYMTTADRLRGLVMFAGTVAVLGGLAGGVLSRDGWQMLAGAVVGAIAGGVTWGRGDPASEGAHLFDRRGPAWRHGCLLVLARPRVAWLDGPGEDPATNRRGLGPGAGLIGSIMLVLALSAVGVAILGAAVM